MLEKTEYAMKNGKFDETGNKNVYYQTQRIQDTARR
jgi:hypothetical protein